jgi:tetratricopeptide (TPR) repeat protein
MALERAARFIEPTPEPIYVRGLSYQALGDYDRAIEAYGALSRTRPGDSAVQLCRAAALSGSDCRARPDIPALVTSWSNPQHQIASDEARYRRAVQYFDSALPSGELEKHKYGSWQAAKEHLRFGDTYIALVLHDKLLELEPGLFLLVESRGNVLASQGKYDQAVAEFSRSIAMVPSVTETLAEIFSVEQAWRNGDRDFDAVTEMLFIGNPDAYDFLISAYEARGRAYAHMGRLDEALADYQRVLTLMPDHEVVSDAVAAIQPFLDVQAMLGHGEEDGSQQQHAEASVGGAISRLHGYWTLAERYAAVPVGSDGGRYGHWRRGKAYLERGMYDIAATQLREALKRDPRSASAWTSMGDWHTAKGDFSGAVSAYSRAVEVSPTLAEARRRRADAHWQLGNYDLAVADFSLILDENDWDDDSLYRRGRVQAEAGRHDLAVADYKAYLGLHVSRPRAHRFLAESLAMLERFAEALAAAAEAVRLQPRYGAGHEMMALMHYALATQDKVEAMPKCAMPAE